MGEKEKQKSSKRGICYISRIPPRMDHIKLRHDLSQYASIERIYLVPQDKMCRKQNVRFSQQGFIEGWVEFTEKSVAKRVANMLNGQQFGGKKRSRFYYDIWNMKYLSKFKWDDLTEEIAFKKAMREQKLALELSAAKKERDLYLSKVDQSHAFKSMEDRLAKKQKQKSRQEGVEKTWKKPVRHFHQKAPALDKGSEKTPRLSMDLLSEVCSPIFANSALPTC